MNRELVNQADVLRLPIPSQGETVFYDRGKVGERVRGLVLRIRAAGSRRWMLYYRFTGLQKRASIGDAETMSLADARKAARKLRVAIDAGNDPAIERHASRAAAGLTFAKVMDDHLAASASQLKARSLTEKTRQLKLYWKPLHALPIANITRPLVAARLREITAKSGPIAANRSRSALSAMFSWAHRLKTKPRLQAEFLRWVRPLAAPNRPRP